MLASHVCAYRLKSVFSASSPFVAEPTVIRHLICINCACPPRHIFPPTCYFTSFCYLFTMPGNYVIFVMGLFSCIGAQCLRHISPFWRLIIFWFISAINNNNVHFKFIILLTISLSGGPFIASIPARSNLRKSFISSRF